MSTTSAIDTGRLGRILVLIAGVTGVFLLTATQQLEGDVLRIGAVAIGAVAVVTAMTGFLIAAGATYDDTQGL